MSMNLSVIAALAAALVLALPAPGQVEWDGSCNDQNWYSCCLISANPDVFENNFNTDPQMGDCPPFPNAVGVNLGLATVQHGDNPLHGTMPTVIGDLLSEGLFIQNGDPFTLNGMGDLSEFHLAGGEFIVNGECVIRNTFRLPAGSGLLRGSGQTRSLGTLEINTSGGTFTPTVDQLLINEGSATWSSGIWTLDTVNHPSTGEFRNDGTFTASLAPGASLSCGGFGTFQNAGTFRVQGDPDGVVTMSNAAFNNTGSVDVQQGNLELRGNGTHTGAWSIASTALLSVGNPTASVMAHQFDAPLTIGPGPVDFTDLVTFGAPNAGTTTVNDLYQGNATIFVHGELLIDRLEWDGCGTFAGPDPTTVNDFLLMDSDCFGASRVIDAATVRNLGLAALLDGILTLDNGGRFENEGVFDYVDGSINSALATQGVLLNTGVFRAMGDPGTRALRFVRFQNNGHVELLPGVTLELDFTSFTPGRTGPHVDGTWTIPLASELLLDNGTHEFSRAAGFGGGGWVVHGGALLQLGSPEPGLFQFDRLRVRGNTSVSTDSELRAAELDFRGGTFFGFGSSVCTGPCTIGDTALFGCPTIDAHILQLNGETTFDSDCLNFANSGILLNRGTLDMTDRGISGVGTLVNEGLVRVNALGGTALFQGGAGIDNRADVQIDDGALQSNRIDSSGDWNLIGAGVQLIFNGSGGTPNHVLRQGTTIRGPGVAEIRTAVQLPVADPNDPGASIENAQLNAGATQSGPVGPGALTITNLDWRGGFFRDGRDFRVNGSMTIPPGGGTRAIDNATLTSEGDATAEAGLTVQNGGVLVNKGTLTLSGTGTLAFLLGAGSDNELRNGSGDPNAPPNGLMRITTNTDFIAASIQSGRVQNFGTMDISGDATTVRTRQSAPLHNDGIIVIRDSALLRVESGGRSTGVFRVQSPLGLEFTGNTYEFQDGTVFSGSEFATLRNMHAVIGTAGGSGEQVTANHLIIETTLTQTSGDGTLTVAETLRWHAGSLRHARTVVDGSLEISQLVASARRLENSTLEINGDAQMSSDVQLFGAATIINNGLFTQTNGDLLSTAGAAATFDNRALLHVAGPFSLFVAPQVTFHNGPAASVFVEGGVLNIDGPGTSDGSWQIAQGQAVRFSPPSGSPFVWRSGTTFFGEGFAIVGETQVDVAGGTVTAEKLTLTDGAALNATGTAAVLEVTSRFDWENGRMTGGLRFHNRGTARLNAFNHLLNDCEFSNFDTTNWLNGTTISAAGGVGAAIVNESGATFNANGRDFVYTNPQPPTGAILNRGVFQKTTDLSNSTTIDGDFVNASGVVRCTAGALVFARAFSQNSGTVELNSGGVIAFQGGATLNGGQLVGRGPLLGSVVNNGASVRPGSSPGTAAIDGDYTQNAGATLEIELAGLLPDTQHDVLAVTGAALLGGTLRLVAVDGFTPQAGQSFQIVTAGSAAGAFDRVELAGFPGKLAADVTVDADRVVVTVVERSPSGGQPSAGPRPPAGIRPLP